MESEAEEGQRRFRELLRIQLVGHANGMFLVRPRPRAPMRARKTTSSRIVVLPCRTADRRFCGRADRDGTPPSSAARRQEPWRAKRAPAALPRDLLALG